MADTAKVDLLKKNWRIEIWCDYRMTETETEAFFDAIGDVAMDPSWPYDALVSAVKKEISDV